MHSVTKATTDSLLQQHPLPPVTHCGGGFFCALTADRTAGSTAQHRTIIMTAQHRAAQGQQGGSRAAQHSSRAQGKGAASCLTAAVIRGQGGSISIFFCNLRGGSRGQGAAQTDISATSAQHRCCGSRCCRADAAGQMLRIYVNHCPATTYNQQGTGEGAFPRCRPKHY